MNAEKRSRFLELYFHIILALFSLVSIGISILGGGDIQRLKSEILTFASITTLCLSLLIFGFKFGESAANHRACYLALQKLRAEGRETAAVLETAFIEILGHHPNHTSGDYKRLAVGNVWMRKQTLESPPGRAIELGRWDRFAFAGGWLLARFALFIFALMPFVMAVYGIMPGDSLDIQP